MLNVEYNSRDLLCALRAQPCGYSEEEIDWYMLVKPVINKRRCSAQKDICTAIKACSKGAVQYIEDEEEPLGGKIIIDYALCDECGLCVAECCGQAIDMKSLEP